MLQDGRDNRKRGLISQEAAGWFARMQDPGVPVDDRRCFLQWLKESPLHIAEYLAIAGMDGDLQRMQLAAILGDDAVSNVIELDTQVDGQAPTSRDVAISGWKVAAAIVALLFAVSLFFVARSAWQRNFIATQPGQWTTQILADGSELQLGPNTLLQVDLGETQRTLTLVRGEACFNVAKDPARPLIVQADAFVVRATGTQFAVARRKSELIVTVEEGSVRVAPSSGFAPGSDLSVPVAADRQLRIAKTWPVAPRRIDVRYELAWRERQLMFRTGDTLEDAVREFNLRNHIQLQLDPRVAAVPVRGTFDASAPLAFARIMHDTAAVAIERLSPDVIVLQPAAQPR